MLWSIQEGLSLYQKESVTEIFLLKILEQSNVVVSIPLLQ